MKTEQFLEHHGIRTNPFAEEDAQTAAPILGIALTMRNKKSADQTPMCGVPHHAIAGPINKLLAHGFKVAICDQIEDPKLAKGIVKRAVTRILSPGMVYDPETQRFKVIAPITILGSDSVSKVRQRVDLTISELSEAMRIAKDAVRSYQTSA